MLNERMDRVQSAIAVLDGQVLRIEGWIEGRFDTQSALTPEQEPTDQKLESQA